ncbi:MAG: ABC transporter ATP-binding protein [Candidatus Dojkabacteria bacterium]
MSDRKSTTEKKENRHLIELKDVYKTYNPGKENAFEALKGINLKIDKGEFVGIMGPSGSGKSTMMNILGALDVPTSGEYLVRGRDISAFSSNQLAEFRNNDVGFVFQQFNLLPKISVAENIILPTLYGDVAERKSKMRSVLNKVGLKKKEHNIPNQLSGGETQRVAIARALIMSPAIIMADEPTGNLDSAMAEDIMRILSEIHKDGNTIILITHEKNIADYAEKIIYLRDGQIVHTRSN